MREREVNDVQEMAVDVLYIIIDSRDGANGSCSCRGILNAAYD